MRAFAAAILAAFILGGCTVEKQEPAVRPSGNAPNTADTVQGYSDTAGLPAKETFRRRSSSGGQLIYVPVYSHIYQQDRKKTFNLTATLSIRNTDPFRDITVETVSYYDSQGELVQHFLDQNRTLPPLSSTSFVVEERDLRGGVGANFLVSWRAGPPASPPVIEAVMISTSQQQGISFLSEGRVLQEYASQEESDK